MILSFSEADVRKLLPLPEAIEAVAESFLAHARGEANMPPRITFGLGRDRRFFRVMPAHLAAKGVVGVKAGCVHPDRRRSAVHYLLYDAETAELLAVFEADWLGQLRTAAASAVATRALARPGPSKIALLGTGKHAWTQLLAVCQVREPLEVRVYSPTPANRAEFVRTVHYEHPEMPVDEFDDPQAALAGADIVVTATRSKEPVLEWSWLSPGVHVNAMGSNVATARELDTETILRSKVVVDSLEQTLQESGDIILPIGEGRYAADRVHGELGKVLSGAIRGRADDQEVTVFKSNGLAIQDLILAQAAFERATGRGRSAVSGAGESAARSTT